MSFPDLRAFLDQLRRDNELVTVEAPVDPHLEVAEIHRRVIAAGAERWLFGKRIGVRGGGRFNQVGHKERSATGGVSAAIRPGMFVEAHAVAGGSDDERGWGVAARVSF